MSSRYRGHGRHRPTGAGRLGAAAVTAAKVVAWVVVLAIAGLVLTAFIALIVEAL